MSGSGPKATHHRADEGSSSAMSCGRGTPLTTGGSQSFNRITSIRVVSNGPITVASDHPDDAMSSAHGQASSSDWSSTMSAAQRMDSAMKAIDSATTRHASWAANRSSSTVLARSSPCRLGSPIANDNNPATMASSAMRPVRSSTR
jgi:hypothetical protein